MRLFIIRGILGWGNRKSGLDAYGPCGRWGGEVVYANQRGDGDLLGDALYRMGAREGATLLVIAVGRETPQKDIQAFFDYVEGYVHRLIE
jgi:hypothetical protein